MAKRLTVFVAVFAALLSVTLSVQADPLNYYWEGGTNHTNTNIFTSGNWIDDNGQTVTASLTTGPDFNANISTSYTKTLEFDNSNFGKIVTLNIGTEAGGTTATVQRTSGNNFVVANGKTLNAYTGGSFTYNYTKQFQTNGTINVSGGSFTIEKAENFRLANDNSTTLTISSGNLTVKCPAYIGVASYTGTINQTGGNATFNSDLDLGWGDGAVGQYNLTGGTLTTTGNAGLWTGNPTGVSTFTVNGGTANFNKADTSFTVGLGGTNSLANTFTLTTGTVNAAGAFVVQHGGQLKIQGGDFNANSVVVDTTTSGSISMTNGTLKTSAIDIGNGTFSQTGGTLTPKNNDGGMSITGDYTLGTNATLKPNGPIAVSGTATLNGTIDLSVYTAKTVTAGDSFTLVSANTITMPDAKKTAIGNALPKTWVTTLSSTTLKTTYDNGDGKFYWRDLSGGDNNMYTAKNWVYGSENSADVVLGEYIGPNDNPHDFSQYTRNCYVYSTSNATSTNGVKIDWSDLGMASLTVGDGTGTRTAKMYSQAGSGTKFNVLTSLTVNKGGTVTMTSSTPTYISGMLSVNGGTYIADKAINIYDGGVLNLSSGGTINVSSEGITNTSGNYTINLSGGTLGTNGSSWSTALNATLAADSTTTFSPGEGETITWSGALDGEGGIIKTGAGDLKITAGDNGQNYTGGTTVSAGTLYLSGTNRGKSSVGEGDLTINSGAAVVAQSHNVFGSNIPNVIINGGTLTPNQYLHMRSLEINSGTVSSHGNSGDGLDFSDRNGTITSTGASSIASKITNRSTLTINVAENGTLSLTNNIDNIQNSSNTTIKTGAGLLTTSGWINANVEVQQGTLQITGQYNNKGKRFYGEVTIDQGAKLECATHDSLGYGTAATKMNIYGLMDNTVGNETFDYIELHMYGGTAQSSSGGSFDILSSNVKFYSHPENESQTTTTESTISSKLVLRHNGTLEIDTKANSQLNLAGEITGLYSSTHYTCSINKLGDGTLVLSSRNPSLYGGTTISAGKVIANAAQSGSNAGKSVFGSGAVEVASGATLDFQVVNQLGYETPNDITIKGTLIPHNFTHVKNVTIQNGVIETENDKTSNGTGLDFDTRTATLASSGTSRIDSRINVNKYSDHLTFNVTDTLTVNGVIREDTGNNAGGGFIKAGAGTMELTADNAYTGTTTISAGTIKLSGSGDLGSGNVVNNATLDFAHTADFTGDNAFANVISGTGVVNKTGTGKLTLSGANTYTGMTNVNAGVLELTGDAVVANGPVTVANDGTLEYNVANGQKKKLSIDATNKILSTGRVIKTGEGTLQLYSEAQGLIDISSLTVSSGQLDLKGYMTGGITVDAGGVFSPGNSVGEATFGGGYILNENGKLLIEQDGSGIDKLNVGSFTFDETEDRKGIIELAITGIPFGSQYDIITSNTPFTGDLLDDNYWLGHFKNDLPEYMTLSIVNNNTVRLSIDRNAVPEPSTWALLVLGVAGLIYWRKRK